jgi:hypothetical protein
VDHQDCSSRFPTDLRLLPRACTGESPAEAATILARMELCLEDLDLLGWTLQAAQLSQAVESVRDMVTAARIHAHSEANRVLP